MESYWGYNFFNKSITAEPKRIEFIIHIQSVDDKNLGTVIQNWFKENSEEKKHCLLLSHQDRWYLCGIDNNGDPFQMPTDSAFKLIPLDIELFKRDAKTIKALINEDKPFKVRLQSALNFALDYKRELGSHSRSSFNSFTTRYEPTVIKSVAFKDNNRDTDIKIPIVTLDFIADEGDIETEFTLRPSCKLRFDTYHLKEHETEELEREVARLKTWALASPKQISIITDEGATTRWAMPKVQGEMNQARNLGENKFHWCETVIEYNRFEGEIIYHYYGNDHTNLFVLKKFENVAWATLANKKIPKGKKIAFGGEFRKERNGGNSYTITTGLEVSGRALNITLDSYTHGGICSIMPYMPHIKKVRLLQKRSGINCASANFMLVPGLNDFLIATVDINKYQVAGWEYRNDYCLYMYLLEHKQFNGLRFWNEEGELLDKDQCQVIRNSLLELELFQQLSQASQRQSPILCRTPLLRQKLTKLILNLYQNRQFLEEEELDLAFKNLLIIESNERISNDDDLTPEGLEEALESLYKEQKGTNQLAMEKFKNMIKEILTNTKLDSSRGSVKTF